ncbi:MAG: stage II sporulation protein M [Candidatus Aenigmarchaeota archaeon]|nr:stage II sporulation protein M [Candidatus Aenigmarchaeota archaeon]
MVLERLVGVKEALKNPFKTFFLGIFISMIALFISYTMFTHSTGLYMTIIITLAALPFMNRLLRYEEKEDESIMEISTFTERYGDIIIAYIAFFSGMTLAMSASFVLLPGTISEKVFHEQITEINIIRGKFEFGNKFIEIFMNNLSVLMISFLFSFLFGCGAIFILAWNASVLASAIGLVSKSYGGVKALPSAVLMFLPHGSFEIGAYLIGAIAGGLVSAAFTRRKSLKFWQILRDSFKLLLVSFVLLIIGGVIETVVIMI